MSEIYDELKDQLDSNVNLLSVYLNVMILSKEFNSNKSFFLYNNEDKFDTYLNEQSLTLNETDTSTKSQTETEKGSINKSSSSSPPSPSILDYDADSEMSIFGEFYLNYLSFKWFSRFLIFVLRII